MAKLKDFENSKYMKEGEAGFEFVMVPVMSVIFFPFWILKKVLNCFKKQQLDK